MSLLMGVLWASAPASAAEVTGYVESRTQFQRSRVAGLVPTDEQAEVQQLLEFNVQPWHAYREGGFVSADLSLFLQTGGRYRGLDAAGREVALAERATGAARPVVSLNELYVSHEVLPQLHLLAGKKRVVWGAGLAYNPTDLLNPPKDPTDPGLQRAGAYLARVEVPLERFAFTFLASPAVLAQHQGLPQALLVYPKWDRQDTQAHYLLAARVYALVADADVNLMLFHSNLYGDALESKTRVGLSFSRYFLKDYELHVEALVGRGSARRYPVGACVADGAAAAGCVLSEQPLFAARRRDERTLRPRVLAGSRYQFGDESLLSLEYLYQSDGLTRGEFQDYVNALGLPRELQDAGRGLGAPEAGVDTGAPRKFSFEPLGRHYAFLSFQKPKIREDFTLAVTVMSHLGDLSGLVTPSLAWASTEWMTLTLSGFVPWRGPRALAATRPGTSTPVSELGLLPLEYRALFQVHLFY
ncbi:hypothetical protein [Archangium primigenium]|uniref:hypothetical protein n=1 Tax=[Archangium] primigenium TaxID=2792470 RepID=UPI00195CF9C8|nr:hypothetical protein [Archangium primigenium]MBM7118881.1 hypothetical protein [Archangium primigenium]